VAQALLVPGGAGGLRGIALRHKAFAPRGGAGRRRRLAARASVRSQMWLCGADPSLVTITQSSRPFSALPTTPSAVPMP
jgi:hypothetical protein